ncbi:flagellar filament capping protein FliD [Tardiphaga sp. 1201_B9_N1_1]|jgi:flagellar hook-associated protein 2|uniref:flagellar filament capping protein FliD n=1 Tax=Tardiphaga TaxID=1395974 RepID=UPI000E7680CC|nr:MULTISPECIES: flagellar filament capping protein FliD [Tardiphaga]NUU45248.1 flagellar filament capping protein FliD [Tardiphaga robiniae]UFS74997.1 flagellar filament capping protein FliD [Tardiphaga sp. 37S4]
MATVTSSTSAAATAALATTTSGTKTTTSVDWDALIEAQVATKTAAATTIQTSITANEAKISAYQQLQTLLTTLTTDTTSLSKSIVNSLSSSAYGARSATITSTGDVSASSAVSMAISNGAATGDHTLTVTQIATAHKVIGTAVADKSADLGLTGTFSIGLEGGTSADISVTSGMTLEDLVDTINAQTSTTNVQASIIQISSNQYEMILSATKDNADITTSVVSGDDVLTTLGVTDSSGAFTDVLQESQPAIFSVDGITLTRDTNNITDVLSGVSFSLLQSTPSGSTVKISIDVDTSSIQTALQQFVTSYNAVRDYVTTQQTLSSSGTADTSAVLFGDGTMRSVTTQMEQVLNSIVGDLSMSDLGLSFSDTNDLVLDTSTLATTLADNIDGVIALLATKTTSSSAALAVVNTSSSPPSSFVMDIAVDSSGALSVSVGGDSSLFTVSGRTIIGKAGTIYSGMAFSYSSTSSASVTITSTIGIAAQINAISSAASNKTSGSLQDLITNLQSQDDRMQQQIDDINERAAIYRTMLTTQYAKYQSAISSANSTLDYLSALLNASSD